MTSTDELTTSSAPERAVVLTSARHRRRLMALLTSLTVIVLIADQVAKAWAVSSLVPGERTPVIGDLLGLSLVYNPGAALSIATGMTWLLTVVAVAVAVVIVRASRRIGSTGWAVALGLLLGGALGNLIDRLFREPSFGRGEVVDFIAYAHVFVGNVADVAIVVAAVVIVLLSMRGIRIDGSLEPARVRVSEADDERGAPQVPVAGSDSDGGAAPENDARGVAGDTTTDPADA
ncbi:MAG: signal peptidase II [Cellulomonas sp.]